MVPERVTSDQLAAGRGALLDAAARQAPGTHAESDHQDAFGTEATLFHLGVTNAPPTKRSYNTQEPQRAAQWASVAPRLGQTLTGYVDQTRVSLRPATVVRIEAVLRYPLDPALRAAIDRGNCDARFPPLKS